MNHYNACVALGLNGNISAAYINIDDVKKAYLNACKLYHPDNVGSDMYLNQFNVCQEAYDFLIKEIELVKNNAVTINNSNSNTVNSVRPSSNKIIGGNNSYAYDHKKYEKKQKEYRKSVKEKKVRELNDIIKKSQELKNNNSNNKLEHLNYTSANGLLDQIRWLRLSKIIHDTIEADKKKQSEDK